MLDIKFIREHPDIVKAGCEKKQVKCDIDKLLGLDKTRREILKKLENIQAQKNKGSKEIVQAKSEKEKKKIISQMRRLDIQSDKLAENLKEVEKEFDNLMQQIPNLPQEDVPIGKDERDSLVLKEVGEKPKFDFEPKDYLELAERLDIIDVKRAAKVSGARFGFIKREAVLLEFALINFVFDNLVKKGFIPILPPVMMKGEMMKGMGYIEQTDRKEAYYLPEDDLFLAATAEQPIGALHADEIFEEEDLPRRYLGFSTCFRREAGSYGKDTKGIFRVHQFDKIEMFSFCHPKKSREEHQFFLQEEEKLIGALKIPYRVVKICTGDLGFPASAKYDIEAWLPFQKKHRETHSTSNCTDFQARRLNIRFKSKDLKDRSQKLEFVHTVNGTAIAIGRIFIAIIENYQQRDGSILVPEVLQQYLSFKIIKRNE